MGAKGAESRTRAEIHDANQPKSTQVNPLLVSLPIVVLAALRVTCHLNHASTMPGTGYAAEHQ